MQRVTFYPIVWAADPGIGIVSRTNPDFMSARKAQANTKTVFELKRTSEIVVFDFGVGKQSHANPKLYIRFYVLAGKLVNQHG
ncbi:hypothetical protein D3C86_1989880 [compost metagenome]